MSNSVESSKVVVPPLELVQNSPDSSDEEAETNENVSRNENGRDVSPESGIDLDSRGTTEVTESESTIVPDSTDRTVIPPNQLFNFDLTDPDEVMRMLESVNLTDEDTEVLLQEAYSVNMKLKELLRRKEKSGNNLNPADAETLKGSNVVVVPGSTKGSAANSRKNSASKRSQFTRTSPLPPINNGPTSDANMRMSSAVYSAKLSRPIPPSASHKRHSSSQERKVVSRNPSAATMHKPKGTKKSVPVSTEERPAWNDRFMY